MLKQTKFYKTVMICFYKSPSKEGKLYFVLFLFSTFLDRKIFQRALKFGEIVGR